MPWRKMLAYLHGSVDQELLLRSEFLAAENRILRSKIQGRLLLTDAERTCLAGIGKRLGRKALEGLSAMSRNSSSASLARIGPGATTGSPASWATSATT
jgi:hypothetical protein